MARSAPRGPSLPASPRAPDRHGRGPVATRSLAVSASLSPRRPCRICYSAPNICSSVPDPLSPRGLMGWAGGCQPWGRSASSAVAATPRRQTRCLLLLVDEALGGYAHVSQCEAPLPVALRLDLLLGGIAT